MRCVASKLGLHRIQGVGRLERSPCIGRLRRVPRGRGRPVRLRHPGRGDARPQRVAGRTPRSSFVPVRHEQGGAFMADMYGRLTGRAGVCLGTLGPGATNLVTAVADAFLDRAPLVALTGQSDLERMHKESHQYIDLVEVMRPITKWNAPRADARRSSPRSSARRSRSPRPRSRARRTSSCPRTSWPMEVDAEPLPRRRIPSARAGRARAAASAADLIRNAINPVALAGNGVVRAGAAPALREFSRATGIAVAETFMGKGVLDYEDPKALGTVGLQSRDYAMAGFEDADVVIAIGYDLVEHAPKHWNPRARQEDRRHRLRPRRDRRVLPARGRARRRHLPRAHAAGRGVPRRPALRRLAAAARGHPRPLRGGQGRRPLPDAAAARAVGDPPGARAARTSSSPTSACTSCGSGGCSPRTSRTR